MQKLYEELNTLEEEKYTEENDILSDLEALTKIFNTNSNGDIKTEPWYCALNRIADNYDLSDKEIIDLAEKNGYKIVRIPSVGSIESFLAVADKDLDLKEIENNIREIVKDEFEDGQVPEIKVTEVAKKESINRIMYDDAQKAKENRNKKVTIKYGSSYKDMLTCKPIKVTMRTLDDYKDYYSFVEIVDESLDEEFEKVSDEECKDLEKRLNDLGFDVVSKQDYGYGDKPTNIHYQIITKEGNQTEESFNDIVAKIDNLLDEFEDETGAPCTFNAGLQEDGYISCGFDVRAVYYKPGEDVEHVKPMKLRYKDGKPADKKTELNLKSLSDRMGADVSKAVPVDKSDESLNEGVDSTSPMFKRGMRYFTRYPSTYAFICSFKNPKTKQTVYVAQPCKTKEECKAYINKIIKDYNSTDIEVMYASNLQDYVKALNGDDFNATKESLDEDKIPASVRRLIDLINGKIARGTDYELDAKNNKLIIGFGDNKASFNITKEQYRKLKELGYVKEESLNEDNPLLNMKVSTYKYLLDVYDTDNNFIERKFFRSRPEADRFVDAMPDLFDIKIYTNEVVELENGKYFFGTYWKVIRDVDKDESLKESSKFDSPEKLLKICGDVVYHATYKDQLEKIYEEGLHNFWFGIYKDECLDMIEYNHDKNEDEVIIAIPTKYLEPSKCNFTADTGDGYSDDWAGTGIYRGTITRDKFKYIYDVDNETYIKESLKEDANDEVVEETDEYKIVKTVSKTFRSKNGVVVGKPKEKVIYQVYLRTQDFNHAVGRWMNRGWTNSTSEHDSLESARKFVKKYGKTLKSELTESEDEKLKEDIEKSYKNKLEDLCNAYFRIRKRNENEKEYIKNHWDDKVWCVVHNDPTALAKIPGTDKYAYDLTLDEALDCFLNYPLPSLEERGYPEWLAIDTECSKDDLLSFGYDVRPWTPMGFTAFYRDSDCDKRYNNIKEDIEKQNELKESPAYANLNKVSDDTWRYKDTIEIQYNKQGKYYYVAKPDSLNWMYSSKIKDLIVGIDRELDENLNEDIEKHDTLNSKLFDGEELKSDVKDAIQKIADTFVEEIKEDDVNLVLKDVVLVGSNVNYNYTKDSDLDIHLIVDSKALDCPQEIVDKLYGCYRTIFNKNYDIHIKGIPAEIYVELDEPKGISNGVYSLNSGWIKKPVQQDIPEIDRDAFNALFNDYEDKYTELMSNENKSSEDVENFINMLYDIRKEGVQEEGEFSLKNLLFKEFRNLGYLDDMKELRRELKGKELSLESIDNSNQQEYNNVGENADMNKEKKNKSKDIQESKLNESKDFDMFEYAIENLDKFPELKDFVE